MISIAFTALFVLQILIFYSKTPASFICFYHHLNLFELVGFCWSSDLSYISTCMRLRSMAAPATKVDVKNINDKLDKMSKTLVENSSTLVQLIEEMREIR